MVSADCNTNGNCICPEPNNSPTTFMASIRISLTILSASISCRASSTRGIIRSLSPSSKSLAIFSLFGKASYASSAPSSSIFTSEKCSMKLKSDWSLGEKSTSSQISRSASLILESGTICLTLIITVVNPAFKQ